MIPLRFFWLFDFVVMVLAFLGAFLFFAPIQKALASRLLGLPWLDAPVVATGQLHPMEDLLWLLFAMSGVTILILGLLGNHRPVFLQSRTRLALGGITGTLVSLSLVTMILFALKRPEWSRLFIFSFAFFGGIGLGLYRVVLRVYFASRRRKGYYAKNVLLIGLHSSVQWIVHYFKQRISPADYRLFGYLSLNHEKVSPKNVNPDCLHYGEVGELGDLLIHQPIHEVIAILPFNGADWIGRVIENCDYFRVALHIVPEALLKLGVRDLQILYRSDSLKLPAVVLQPPHLDSSTFFLKRLLDIMISATLLIVLLPIFGLIALTIKLTTPHLPVFYPWRVVGYKGKHFVGYKFTTMVADADERKAELISQNEMNGPVFKIKKDPRITPLGRFLRKYSLNEFPQLWSVLKGDMSLVGPRPAGPHELIRYEFWQKRKLSIKPGITCLWQVRGRNRINNFDDWVKLDLEYIDKWSLWLDFKILLRTAWVVVRGTGS